MTRSRRSGAASPPILVEVVRGERVESVHRGIVAVVAPDGSAVASVGDPDAFVFWRSSAKPFQLAPFVASGRFDDYELGTEALAIMAASHSGEDRHVRLVQETLRRAGLTSAVLQNQVHAPFDTETAHRLLRDGEKPTILRGNCSGKHAGMVLFAKASGWPLDGYWHPEHPVQRMALETVSALSDVPIEEIATAVDGCGVVTFGTPIRGLALAIARLADPAAVADPPLRTALARIRDAMMAHPELVGGARDRLDTSLMKAAPGRLVSKSGMEALRGVGILRGRRSNGVEVAASGMAIKIEDGDGYDRGTWSASVEALRQAGVLEGQALRLLARYHRPPILDPHGRTGAEAIADFELAPVGELIG